MLDEIKNNHYDMLILDEVHVALDMKLLQQYQYFDFLKDKDGTYNKHAVAEVGKIAAGGIQGLNTTSVENAKLAEARRLTDIQRANAASVGKSNYGILRS